MLVLKKRKKKRKKKAFSKREKIYIRKIIELNGTIVPNNEITCDNVVTHA